MEHVESSGLLLINSQFSTVPKADPLIIEILQTLNDNNVKMYVFEIVTHCFFVKLLFVLYFVSITTYEDVSYTAEVGDTALQEVKREFLSQKIIIYPCPDGFETHGNLCVYFKANTSYPPKCPYEEMVSFNTYIDLISLPSPIWMPVRRDRRNNGIGQFHWMEPNSQYKSLFDPCKDDSCSFLNNNEPHLNECVIYHNRSIMKAISCSERATAVCAYDHLHKKLKSFCSQKFSASCKQSDFSTKSKCFCKSPTTNLEKAEFLIPYQNLVYHSITDDLCYMGLMNTGTTFIWTTSRIIVNYTYWATETYPTIGGDAFGAISSDGWTLLKTNNQLSCTFYQQDIPENIHPDEMFLHLNDINGSFILKLINLSNWVRKDDSVEPLILCFSDASAESLLEIIDTKYQKGTDEFWFKPISSQSGHYWCEGFLYPDLELKTSNEYLLKADKEEYVTILKLTFEEGSDPTSQSNFKRYKQFLDQFLARQDFHTRIFKITEVDTKMSQISINFHVSTDNSATEIITWTNLWSALRQPHENITFDKLLSVHFCLPMVASHNNLQISWPTTRIGEVADKPLEGWCVDSEGHILKRKCEGNFVDGAEWEEFRQICSLVDSVNHTINLTNIVNSEDPTRYLEQMAEITTNYGDFSFRDVALVADFLEQLAQISTTDIESVSEIVNNLGKIAQSIIAHLGSRILKSVDEIILKANQSKILLGETLSIASFEIARNNTLILLKDTKPIEIKFSELSHPEDLSREQYFDSALFLKKTIWMRSFEKLSILIYSNPIFFSDKNSYNTQTIYRMLLSKEQGDVEVSVIYHNKFDVNEVVFHRCSTWTFVSGEITGYWRYHARADYNADNLICDFKSSNYSTMQTIQFSENSITDELIRINNSSLSSQFEKLAELRDVLVEFKNSLIPSDLYYIYQILNKVESVVLEEFTMVADIIDNVSRMNRTILLKSLPNIQDLILDKLTMIMENYETSIEINKSNFFLLVFHMNSTADTEFIINTCTEFCSVIVISRLDTDPSRVTSEDIEIIVYISAELVNQLKKDNDSKLLLTVFNDDTMFLSTDSNERDISKIVGVQFPGFNKPLEGDIRIEYRVNDAMINQSCEFWHGSYWDRDNSPTKSEHFSNCSFWKSGYYSLRFNIVNITLIIEEHLQDDDVNVILENLNEVLTKYYNRFSYYDLYLITHVFDKIVTFDERTVDSISEMVSVITRISRDVLDEAQEKYQTTDTILSNLNKLAGLMKLKKVYKYQDSNILMMISSVKQSAIVGVRISDCEIECKFKELLGNDTDDNVSKILNMTSIRMSQEFYKKLVDSSSESKLIIILFHNDALFSTSYQIGQSNIIFGIGISEHDLFENEISLSVGYSTEGYCISWDMDDDSRNWRVVGRMNNSICNFRQPGYLSYINEDITANITQILEFLLESKSSNIIKLKEILSISHLYEQFKSIDVFILTNVLLQIISNETNIDPRVFENMFLIPKDILIQSQIEHNALSNVLTIINSIGNNLNSNNSYIVNNHFSLITCPVATKMSAVINDGWNIWCTQDVDESHFGRLTLEDELVSNILSTFNDGAIPEFTFIHFRDSILFTQQEDYVPSIILGLNIPHYDGSLRNGISINITETKYNLEVYTCAYWEYIKYEYGYWWPVSTRMAGAYKNCNFYQGEYFSIIIEHGSRNITQILELISDSSISHREKLVHTFELIDQYKLQLDAKHVSIISTIIGQNVDDVKSDLNLIGDIANSLMNVNKTVLVQSQNLYNATHEVVDYIDSILTKHSSEDVNLQFNNFAILIQGNFSGISLVNCTRSCKIRPTSIQLENLQNVEAVLSIDQKLKKYLDESSLRTHITIYFNDVLFNEGCIGCKTDINIIVGVTIPGVEETRWKGSVRFQYRNRPDKADICAYWNWNYEDKNGILIRQGHWEMREANFDSMWVCPSRIESTHFAILNIEKNVTSDLENILNDIYPIGDQLEKVNVIVTTNTDTLSPMDIFLIAKILGRVARQNETTHEHVFYISKLMSSLIKVNRTTLRTSQKMYYATDIILYNLDQILLRRQVITEVSDSIQVDNFTVITYKLSDTDIRGLSLEGCRNDTCNSSILYRNTDISIKINNGDFRTALILNDDLLRQINESKSSVYLIVTVFFQDVLFNEESRFNYSTSIICGVLLKGLIDPLRGNVSIIYRAKQEELHDNSSCAFWDYKIPEQEGFWNGGIVPKNEGQVMICDHTHVTHFVLLLASSSGIFLEISGSKVLDTITNINSVLSLFGIFGILVTALLFDKWRNNIGNQILVHFSFAISIKNVMLYISVGVWDESGSSGIACTITGGILHYSILSEFGWMLIIAILQFKRFVEVLGIPTKYILLKACICGWVFPAIPVFLTLIIDLDNYSAGKLGLCYPSGLGLYLGIWLPLLIIILINSIIFVVIVYNIFHKRTESRDQVNHEILFQWRLALLLFFMLGLTWMFGFLSLSGEYFFMVVFCFVATLQGFVIFMFFIVLNKSTRILYVQAFKLWMYSNDYGNKFM